MEALFRRKPITIHDTLQQVYKIEWTINKFSELKMYGCFTSPHFQPMNCGVYFQLKLFPVFLHPQHETATHFDCVLKQMPINKHWDTALNITLVDRWKIRLEIDHVTNLEFLHTYFYEDIDFHQFSGRHSRYEIKVGWNDRFQNEAQQKCDFIVVKCICTLSGHFLSELKQHVKQPNILENLEALAKKFSEIRKTGRFCDYEIRTGLDNEKIFPVHKFIVAGHSDTFATAINSRNKTLHENAYTIEFYNAQIVDCFIEYLYSGKLEEHSYENLRDIYFMADQFFVAPLKKKCAEEIIRLHLNMENVCNILHSAYALYDDYLKLNVESFIIPVFGILSKTHEWKYLLEHHKEILATFLKDKVRNNKQTKANIK